MTVNEMRRAIGQKVQLRVSGGLYFDVVVEDVRQVWVRVDCLVKPVSGAGSSWVSMERLTRSALTVDGLRDVRGWLNG